MKPEKIEAIIKNTGNSLTVYGADSKTVKAASLALEEILLELPLDNDKDLISCGVTRTEQFLSVDLEVGKNVSVDMLKNPDDSLILSNICKYNRYKLSVSSTKQSHHIRLLLETYHPFSEDIAFLYKYLDKDKTKLTIGGITHVISIIANIFIPFLSGKLIVAYTDNVLVQIITVSIAIMISRYIYAITFNLAGIFYNYVSYRLRRNLHFILMEEFFKIKESVVESVGAGPFLERITADTKTISAGISTLLDIITEFIYYIGIFIATFFVSKTVFLMELIMFAILAVLERRRSYYLGIDQRRAYSSFDKSTGITVDLVRGYQDVKLLNGKKMFSDKLRESLNKQTALIEKAEVNSRRRVIIGNLFVATGYAFIMIYLGYSISNNTLSIADALVAFNYYSLMGTPMVVLVQRYISYKKEFCVSCERVRNVIEGIGFPKEQNGTVKLTDVKGNLCMKDVSFSYYHDDPLEKDLLVIKDINLEIKAGEMVAFVGKSGCGKTTILRLLTGQRKCNSGTVSIDGVDYKEIDKASLYDNISVISQRPYVFNTSVRENLLFAKVDATQEEMEEACRKACILPDVQRMESGFDTVLGEGGVKLSGGQCQRLALARAFLRQTPVIFLDEATSALDNVTQEKVMDEFSSMEGKHTIVIVAHRLSTIINADKIFVVADNTIKDSGTHEELINRCEEYRALYKA